VISLFASEMQTSVSINIFIVKVDTLLNEVLDGVDAVCYYCQMKKGFFSLCSVLQNIFASFDKNFHDVIFPIDSSNVSRHVPVLALTVEKNFMTSLKLMDFIV
jgi:hypothetical protein